MAKDELEAKWKAAEAEAAPLQANPNRFV